MMPDDQAHFPAPGRSQGEPFVRMRQITRRFGAVIANNCIDLDLYPGQIHALLGENGAGKSTLMHILSGLLRPDTGSIELDGREARFADPGAAIRAGIGIVHQHFKLVPTMTVAANILLNEEPTVYGLLDDTAADAQVSGLCSRFGLHVDPHARVGDLSVAAQQKVEILKAVRRQVRLLILDEPTAVLTPQEVRDLFEFLRGLAAGGTGVVLITHKLIEALSIADRLTVLRAGHLVVSRTPEGLTPVTLSNLMVGRDVLLVVRKKARSPGPVVMALRGVRAVGNHGLEALRGVDLDCRAGQILGLAGVDGNGQRELVEVMAGMRPMSSGHITWQGAPITIGSAAEQIQRGIAYIPEDRQRRGLVMALGVSENLILRRYRLPPFSKRAQLRRSAIAAYVRKVMLDYDIRAGKAAAAAQLSGGTQQKVVVSRELSAAPKLLIAAQPTRGIDVGATQFVYDQLIAQRDANAAIVLVSFDLDELLALSDRIAVMYEGRIVADLDRSRADIETLGAYMTGVRMETQDA
jgi:general nucleoside transport system ATP-binding protein